MRTCMTRTQWRNQSQNGTRANSYQSTCSSGDANFFQLSWAISSVHAPPQYRLCSEDSSIVRNAPSNLVLRYKGNNDRKTHVRVSRLVRVLEREWPESFEEGWLPARRRPLLQGHGGPCWLQLCLFCGGVVNATLKKYRRYRYSNLRVAALPLPLPLPLLEFKSNGATDTLSRNSYNKVANATGGRPKTNVPRRKAGVGAIANFTCLSGDWVVVLWDCLRDASIPPQVSAFPGGNHIRWWQSHGPITQWSYRL